MSLLKEWRDYAYGLDDRTPEGKEFWVSYFQAEKGVYEQLLANPLADPVHGTVKELAEKYGLTIQYMIGFLDGIDDSLAESNNLDDVTEDSEVKQVSGINPKKNKSIGELVKQVDFAIVEECKINEDIHQCSGQVTCNIAKIINDIRNNKAI